jgi:hypothetical protein
MIVQLAIGSLVIAMNVAIQAEMFALLHRHFPALLELLRRPFRRWANTVAITVSVLFILLVHTLQVWLWAGILLLVGALDALEPALYFALVSFSTIGYGDIVMTEQWRLLSAMIGANGLLMFGWSIAYMVDLVRRTA